MENVPQTAREIIHSLPERFRPEKVEEGIEAILHFDISGDRGGQFTVEIKDGKCTKFCKYAHGRSGYFLKEGNVRCGSDDCIKGYTSVRTGPVGNRKYKCTKN